MSARRRSSSQYTLFPSCPPLPSQTSPANAGAVAVSTHIPSRSNSASGRKAADRGTTSEAKENRRHTTNGTSSSSTSTSNTIVRVLEQFKQSTNMNRLIPLKPEASSVTSTTTNITIPSNSPAYPPSNGARPEIPSRSSSKRSRPAPVTDLTIFPYTGEEWRKVMEEVKVLYLEGQYKQCSMRSKQILDGIKDPYRVHPLYSIYLSFFAASSLEMTASSLHDRFSAKIPLFREALSFYEKAESYLEYASISADPEVFIQASRRSSYSNLPNHNTHSYRATHHASNSSISSTTSVRSSIDSIFSHRSPSACSFASSIGSPSIEQDRSSPSNLHRCSSSLSSRSSSESFRPGHQQRPKKKVSFSSQLTILLSETEVPILSNQSTLIDAFPSPPSQSGESSSSTTVSMQKQPTYTKPENKDTDISSSYILTQSITRYRTHLSDLSVQLNYHITSIHASITSLSCVRKPRRSNGPDPTTNFLNKEIFGGIVSAANRGEMQRAELQERIRKLKEQGWRRKRFDGERYRVLCERALDELKGGSV